VYGRRRSHNNNMTVRCCGEQYFNMHSAVENRKINVYIVVRCRSFGGSNFSRENSTEINAVSIRLDNGGGGGGRNFHLNILKRFFTRRNGTCRGWSPDFSWLCIKKKNVTLPSSCYPLQNGFCADKYTPPYYNIIYFRPLLM